MKHPPSDIAACVVDIDATVTDDRAEPQISSIHPLNNAVLNLFIGLMEEQGWEHAAARKALIAYGNEKIFWDYPDFIRHFRLPEKEAGARLVRWHEEEIIVYPDAVAMIRRLHDAGMPLFIVSNNPLSGCFHKLHRAGLSGLRGSDYFQGVFGSNVSMGQKHSLAFWEQCFERIGRPPRRIAIIGDNPREDGAVPRTLGVETVFLVDRKRTARLEWLRDAFHVNTLECVPELLLPAFHPDGVRKERGWGAVIHRV